MALTRARYEALLVYSGCNETSRDSRLAEGKKSAAPSNFWLETRDSMNGIVTAVREPDNLSDDVDGSPHTLGLDLPDGYFVGEHARDFENAWWAMRGTRRSNRSRTTILCLGRAI